MTKECCTMRSNFMLVLHRFVRSGQRDDKSLKKLKNSC